MTEWKLVAVDPGDTSGYSTWTVHDAGKPTLISSGQVLTWRGLDDIIGDDTGVVVVEAFRLFPHRAKEQIGSAFPAAQVIGVISYLCEQRGIRLVQVPAGNKEFYTDTKLSEGGWMHYAKGDRYRNRHAMDSIRHALHYLHFTFGIPVMEGPIGNPGS